MVLTCFFVVSLIVSNIIAAKVVCIGWIEIPAAVIAYPITFLCTDVISEIWGREEARRTVHLGFVVQIFSLILIYIAIYLPPAEYMLEFQSSFAETLGTSARFVLASLVAYGVAQTLDVHLFHWLRGRFEPKWMRNNGSTMVSQLVDTVIFITIGFWGVVGGCAESGMDDGESVCGEVGVCSCRYTGVLLSDAGSWKAGCKDKRVIFAQLFFLLIILEGELVSPIFCF